MKNRSARPLFAPKSLGLLRSEISNWSPLGELSAGVTVGLIALPLAIALGIASVPPGAETPAAPPALGLLTAVIAGFLISLLGGSRVQIGGPTAAFIPIVYLVVSRHGYAGLLLATMMAGGILVLMGCARMGALIKFIPWPVTSGFTTGIALAILISQIPDFTGLASAGPMPLEFIERLRWLAENARYWNPATTALGAACLAVVLAWPRLGIRAIPGSIAAIVAATLLVTATGIGEALGITTIGGKFGENVLPRALPAPALPAWNWELLRGLIGPATAIALLGAIESLLSAVVADGLTGQRHDSNTELIAQGVANIVCPFFGGLPATGAIARTAANIHNGAKTPLAGMLHALTLLAVMFFIARWVALIPMAAMSAVLAGVALRMGEWHELARAGRMPRSDALVLLTTMVLTVVFDLVIAVEVGMVLAAILFIKRVSETTEVSRVTNEDMLERPEHIAQGKDIPPGVLVYRIFGPFLFGAAEKMEDAISGIERLPKVLILRLHLVTAMDATGLNVLQSIVERMKSAGGAVILSGIHRQPLELLRNAGFIDVIGRENFQATFDDSLARARELIEAGPGARQAGAPGPLSP